MKSAPFDAKTSMSYTWVKLNQTEINKYKPKRLVVYLKMMELGESKVKLPLFLLICPDTVQVYLLLLIEDMLDPQKCWECCNSFRSKKVSVGTS